MIVFISCYIQQKTIVFANICVSSIFLLLLSPKLCPFVAVANGDETIDEKEEAAAALSKWKLHLDYNQSHPLLSSWDVGESHRNWVGFACDESGSHLTFSWVYQCKTPTNWYNIRSSGAWTLEFEAGKENKCCLPKWQASQKSSTYITIVGTMQN